VPRRLDDPIIHGSKQRLEFHYISEPTSCCKESRSDSSPEEERQREEEYQKAKHAENITTGKLERDE
jgi:hypothetical protein